MMSVLKDPLPAFLRKVGFVLFIAAFIVPAGRAVFVPTEREHAHDYLQLFWGARVFIDTPQMAFALPLWRGAPLDDGFTPYEIFIRVVLLAAWAGNFATFFKLPRVLAYVAICLPWLAYVLWFSLVAAFIPVYFWAIGISLIHLPGALEKKKPNQPAQTTPGSSAPLRV